MHEKKDILTEDMVGKIIAAKKYIKQSVDTNNLPLSDNKRFRLKKYDLECDEYDCKMIIRQNTDRPTNFSVILVYKDAKNGEQTIVRYNGNHGDHKNRLEKETIKGPHIHRMTERYQLNSTHPDGYAEATDRYSDLNSAVQRFMEDMNIRDIKQKGHPVLEDY